METNEKLWNINFGFIIFKLLSFLCFTPFWEVCVHRWTISSRERNSEKEQAEGRSLFKFSSMSKANHCVRHIFRSLVFSLQVVLGVMINFKTYYLHLEVQFSTYDKIWICLHHFAMPRSSIRRARLHILKAPVRASYDIR